MLNYSRYRAREQRPDGGPVRFVNPQVRRLRGCGYIRTYCDATILTCVPATLGLVARNRRQYRGGRLWGTPRSAGAYARLSDDQEGSGLNVEGQLRRIRESCAAQGWPLTAEFTDNSVSATSGVTRDGWEDLLAALRSGQIDCVIVTKQDRLLRVEEDKIRIHDIVRYSLDQPARFHILGQGDLDFWTASGLMQIDVTTAFSTYEIRLKNERSREGILEKAREGRPYGGGKRPYGFCKAPYRPPSGGRERMAWVGIDELEADIIRECAGRVLAGETLRSICLDLNQRGLPTTEGKVWQAQSLRQILFHTRISGRRQHGDEVVCENAHWPRIIPIETSEKLRELLADPRRRTAPPIVAKHLLTGFCRCHKCLYTMNVRYRTKDQRDEDRRYKCHGKNLGHCGVTGIHAGHLEGYVTARVINLLRGNEWQIMRQRQGANAMGELEVRAVIETDQAEIAAIQEDLDADVVRYADVRDQLQKLKKRIEANSAQLAALVGRDPLVAHLGRGDEYERDWKLKTLEWKRGLFKLMIRRITIGASTGSTFDSGRVHIEWKI